MCKSPLYLGVDSGGSKTAFVLADADGRIAARHAAGGGNFLRRAHAEVETMIETGAREVCRMAGIVPGEIAYAAFGFPGYGETETSAAELDALCARALGMDRVLCTNDAVIAWAGSLALSPGINIIAGTGANCYGRAADGREARTSGWGAYCDEGSGQWIGNQAVGIFTKQADGRMPKTPLYDIFRAHFELDDDLMFCHTLNRELAEHSSELAKLQLLVLKAYDQGDPHAQAIYARGGEELWLAIRTTAEKLGFEDGAYRVSYSGGVFGAGERILGPLGACAAGHAELVAPRFSPVLGAVLMAYQAAGLGIVEDSFAFQEEDS